MCLKDHKFDDKISDLAANSVGRQLLSMFNKGGQLTIIIAVVELTNSSVESVYFTADSTV